MERLSLRLGTRKSKLALTQSEWVVAKLKEIHRGIDFEFVKITTKGDKILDVPLAKIGGKGLFVKEIEEALLRGEIDFAVHSLKDVPVEVPEGLCADIFPEREDPRDAFVSNDYEDIYSLKENARVGTSSLRRMAQLKALRPDINVLTLRGNVDTRLRKLDEGEFDAIILAAAGLKRLGLKNRIRSFLPVDLMIPAIGQGALALEYRQNDEKTIEILKPLAHHPTTLCVRAERAFLRELQGGCQFPVGAHAFISDGKIHMTGFIGDEAGNRIIKGSITGDLDDPEVLGKSLARQILNDGGAQIIDEITSRNR